MFNKSTAKQKSASWSKLVGYVPSNQQAAAQLATSDPQMAPFVTEVGTARARTAQLGTAYPKASEALWTAIQACLAGGKSPQEALAAAQAQATS